MSEKPTRVYKTEQVGQPVGIVDGAEVQPNGPYDHVNPRYFCGTQDLAGRQKTLKCQRGSQRECPERLLGQEGDEDTTFG